MKRIILTVWALFMLCWLPQEVGAEETKANYFRDSASWTERGRSAQVEREDLTPAQAAANVVEKADAMIHVLSYFILYRDPKDEKQGP